MTQNHRMVVKMEEMGLVAAVKVSKLMKYFGLIIFKYC